MEYNYVDHSLAWCVRTDVLFMKKENSNQRGKEHVQIMDCNT